MEIKLEQVKLEGKDVLQRLLQYSLFEESGTDLNEMNSDGTFAYEWFDHYFTDKDRDAYFIKEMDNDKLLGFVMVNEHLEILKDGHSIAEFMVIPKYRRRGIGKKAAIHIFEKYKGNWEIKPSYGSEKAYLFWENVIREYTGDRFQYKKSIFVFQTVEKGNSF